MILYLHGFLSSPASAKARLVQSALQQRGRAGDFVCPPLPVSPRSAAELVLALAQLEDPAALCCIGSSLGGYYATWLAEHTGCRAVLLNPAVRPYELLESRLGWQTDYGGQSVEVRAEFLDELRALEVAVLTRPERYLVFAATGDEVIAYEDMIARYTGCPTRSVESDNALGDFAQYLPEVLHFCGID